MDFKIMSLSFVLPSLIVSLDVREAFKYPLRVQNKCNVTKSVLKSPQQNKWHGSSMVCLPPNDRA